MVRELDIPRGYNIEWKTGHGIREKLLAAGFICGTKEYEREYQREYRKIHRECVKLAQSKYYWSKPRSHWNARAKMYRERNKAKRAAEMDEKK